MQENLRWTWDGLYILSERFNVFPESGNGWTIKNWGPVVVPAKGITVNYVKRYLELQEQKRQADALSKELESEMKWMQGQIVAAMGKSCYIL